MSRINTETIKRNPKIFNFLCFYAFLSRFRQTSWIGMFERVNKETVGCPVVLIEEIIALIGMKMSQIDTEKDKNPRKFFQFSKILSIFFPNFGQTSSTGT